MSDQLERARSYIAKAQPAGAGGRNNALNQLAYALAENFTLSEIEFESLLLDWAASCSPPLPDGEASNTIRSAYNGASRKGTAGSKVRRHSYGKHSQPASFAPRIAQSRPQQSESAKAKPYALDASGAMPEPITDGTRALLQAAFLPGEGVRIVPATLAEDGKEIPEGQGPTLSVEEWGKKLDARDGDPNNIFRSTAKTGIYIAINPLRIGGSLDSDVTAFRHALIEFDSISPAEQWQLITKSNIPCTAVIHSGGRSVHAWVRVDAKDRTEYAHRVKALYDHFAAYGIDDKNKNPGRLSRLPNCERFDQRQELLALNCGAASYGDWLEQKELSGDGQTIRCAELEAFTPDFDPSAMLGNRWLCRGGSCFWIGPSGIGKSSLSVQAAIQWGLGESFFGIAPATKLKSVVIQAENDMGDLSEMYQGVCKGMKLDKGQRAQVNDQVIFIRNSTHTGQEFANAAHRIIQRHRPDLVWIDPFLSYLGDDAKEQKAVSKFLRNWLNPISEAEGVVWMLLHHTGKPPQDQKAQKDRTATELAYLGAGSSEIVNWARAVVVLRQMQPETTFEMLLAKRGNRAGATAMDGTKTNRVFMRHATNGIRWEQCAEPDKPRRFRAQSEPKPSVMPKDKDEFYE